MSNWAFFKWWLWDVIINRVTWEDGGLFQGERAAPGSQDLVASIRHRGTSGPLWQELLAANYEYGQGWIWGAPQQLVLMLPPLHLPCLRTQNDTNSVLFSNRPALLPSLLLPPALLEVPGGQLCGGLLQTLRAALNTNAKIKYIHCIFFWALCSKEAQLNKVLLKHPLLLEAVLKCWCF